MLIQIEQNVRLYVDVEGAGLVPRGQAGLMSLWAGRGVGLSRRLPAVELVEVLANEMATAASAFGKRTR
jgi:hypothetical protein